MKFRKINYKALPLNRGISTPFKFESSSGEYLSRATCNLDIQIVPRFNIPIKKSDK